MVVVVAVARGNTAGVGGLHLGYLVCTALGQRRLAAGVRGCVLIDAVAVHIDLHGGARNGGGGLRVVPVVGKVRMGRH